MPLGRPTLYDAEVHARIVAALKNGATLRQAATIALVSWPTFTDWLRAGRRWLHDPETRGADARFADFARDVDAVQAERDAAMVSVIERAALGTPWKAADAEATGDATPEQLGTPGDWRAAAFLVEHRASAPERRERVRKLRAETKVAEKRANGSLPAERSEITGANGAPLVPATDPSALHARLAAVAARAARGAERRGAGGDVGGGADGDRGGA